MLLPLHRVRAATLRELFLTSQAYLRHVELFPITQLPSPPSPRNSVSLGIIYLPLELLHDIFALLPPKDFLSCRHSCSFFLHSSEYANLFSTILNAPRAGKLLSGLKSQLFHDAIRRYPRLSGFGLDSAPSAAPPSHSASQKEWPEVAYV
jgi:hypothetical protein